jgi:hypothetical protein
MALEGQQGIVTDHATAVIGDLDELFASGFDLNLDPGGTGVHGIFQKFLDHGGGAFHHLTGGNLVGNGLGKNVDASHGSVHGGQWQVSQMSEDKAKAATDSHG